MASLNKPELLKSAGWEPVPARQSVVAVHRAQGRATERCLLSLLACYSQCPAEGAEKTAMGVHGLHSEKEERCMEERENEWWVH